MKVTFTFTDSSTLEGLSKDDIYKTYLEIPDEAQYLIGYEQRILAIAAEVGKLTRATLHISCKELGLKNHPIKTTQPSENPRKLNDEINVMIFQFRNQATTRDRRAFQLKILSPILPPFPQSYLIRRGRRAKSLSDNLIRLNWWQPTSDENQHYMDSIQLIAEQVVILMNAQPNMNWRCAGFQPRWTDNTLIDRHNKRIKRHIAEERKREREEEKQKALEAKMALKPVTDTQSPGPKTGAGRRPGAIPGVFKGVQFRSQLEIRFATELESRGIRWEYEIERLGEGQYLVDFYLPDYACWVEVKGRFEPRDEYLLKDAAGQLIRERNQALFVYMQSKCYEVQPTTFQEMKRDDFWAKLVTMFRQS